MLIRTVTRTMIVLAVALLVSGILYLVTPASAAGPQRGPRPGGDQQGQQAPPGRPEGGPERGGRGGGNWSFAAAGPVFSSLVVVSVVTVLGVLAIRFANGRKFATVQDTGTES